jgi:putative heme iron utilization protein
MTNSEPRPTGPRPLDPAYDATGEARRLLRAVRAGSLATLMPGGHPFVSLVNVATDHDGAPILLLSQLALHTRYLDAEPRASVLLSQGGKGDPLAHPRLTMIGRARKVEGETRERLRRRFLARHPKSALYADFPDFSFWRLEILGAHLNGGFARAADFEAAAIATSLAGAEALLAAEEDALAHLNADHAGTLRLYATHLAGEPDGAWKAVGLDPEGLDLARGDLSARIAFPRRISTPGELRALLAELARDARAQSSENP